MKNKILIILLFNIFISKAQNVLSLYRDKVPGSENWSWQEKEIISDPVNQLHTVYNVTKPTLMVYSPDKALNNGTTVIICPGGGFHHLAIDKEGTRIAKWLNSKGITAFVFKYRLVKTEFDTSGKEIPFSLDDRKKFDSIIVPVVSFAITDALIAIKYVREHAAEYAIEKNRIGIMGFSAGGAVATGTVFSPDGIGSRPDFVAAIYAYTDPFKEILVPSDAPPAFIAAATDDLLVPATSSTKLYNDWIAAGKSAELHIYSKGGHGFGMSKNNLPVDSWIDRFGDWLGLQGLL
ncbi:alpha/beta hydrolase [Flavobacterium gawalongense]|uniref:Alpha/beta hydrolase n=1 Tax=Flavobacterium gawalongense TaxID=2594432 RepID=A0A553BSL2_9FLAO|nr:alpha/beta hydrolase [Flavobacterium gawalongense]TRX11234.1 alpha/beta hydrolase [Flavobacterium gawalongense]TRX12305.1 alpha/beta hydrolase [Flavobacterium gawalongense]TRX30156.1 alpha/beta hydrolase [Flavobacterium gawalongense]